MEHKKELRRNMISMRNHIPFVIRKEKDRRIYERFISSHFYKKSSLIFIFVSYGSETDTQNIIRKALEDGKRICVPKVTDMKGGIMEAVEIGSLSDLSLGIKGILEPEYDSSKIVEPEDIDLAVVPGVAFDKDGGRLGYGGGFYDRFLCKIYKKKKIVGLCYAEQIVDSVPVNTNDIKIKYIITD